MDSLDLQVEFDEIDANSQTNVCDAREMPELSASCGGGGAQSCVTEVDPY